jgi:hypothetical protein
MPLGMATAVMREYGRSHARCGKRWRTERKRLLRTLRERQVVLMYARAILEAMGAAR